MLLPCLLLAATSASARAENDAGSDTIDFYVMGGALRGLNETTWTASSGFIYRPTERNLGLGFAYVNDGHLLNNHRDGLVAQLWYVRPLGDDFEVQLGIGPYASMNNTNNANGVRVNQFEMGLFSSVALKWRFSDNGWYLRSQFNNTWVPGSFNSNALLFGAGRDFTSTDDLDSPLRLRASVSVWGGSSRTTQIGTQQSGAAYMLQAQYLIESPNRWWDPAAYSVGFLSEGNTVLAHRTGIPIQVWWTTPPARRVTFGFGVGPYLAQDGARDENKLNLLGILSLRATYQMWATNRHAVEAGFMYTRVASFYNRDQDIFMLGLRLAAKR